MKLYPLFDDGVHAEQPGEEHAFLADHVGRRVLHCLDVDTHELLDVFVLADVSALVGLLLDLVQCRRGRRTSELWVF